MGPVVAGIRAKNWEILHATETGRELHEREMKLRRPSASGKNGRGANSRT
jgi:hypothetical protein